MTQRHSAAGFTLVETLIAAGLLVTAVAGLAQLFALSARFTRDGGQFGVAQVAAQDKIEMLRALTFGYGAGGSPITDSRLDSSPPESLGVDVGGYVDWLDEHGAPRSETSGAAYVRRWRVTTIAADEPETIAIEVCVFRLPGVNTQSAHADACLTTIRVRQP